MILMIAIISSSSILTGVRPAHAFPSYPAGVSAGALMTYGHIVEYAPAGSPFAGFLNAFAFSSFVIQVTNVAANNVSGTTTILFTNGTIRNNSFFVDVSQGANSGSSGAPIPGLSVLIAGNLEPGERTTIDPTSPAINATAEVNFAGSNREANLIASLVEANSLQGIIVLKTVGFWDRASGVLLEDSIIVMSTGSNSAILLSIDIQLTSTNLWGASSQPDFTVNATPQGSGTLWSVNLTSVNSFKGNLTLTASPSAVNGYLPGATLNPSLVDLERVSTNTALLTVKTPTKIQAGTYFIDLVAVNGSSTGLTHTLRIALTIGGPGFSLSVSPNAFSLTRGSSTTFDVNITSQDPSVGGTAILSAVVFPSVLNVPSAIVTSPAVVPFGGSTLVTMTVGASGVAPGAYKIVVAASIRALSRDFTVSLYVYAPLGSPFGGLNIDANPVNMIVEAGGTSTSALNVTSYDFRGAVAVDPFTKYLGGSSASVPLTFSLSFPASSDPYRCTSISAITEPRCFQISPGQTVLGQLIVTIPIGTPNGTYNVGLTAEDWTGYPDPLPPLITVSHEVTVDVISPGARPNYKITADVDSLSVPAGSASSSVMTFTSQNGFTGVIRIIGVGFSAYTGVALIPPTMTQISGAPNFNLTADQPVAKGRVTFTVPADSGLGRESTTLTFQSGSCPDCNKYQFPFEEKVVPSSSPDFVLQVPFCDNNGAPVCNISGGIGNDPSHPLASRIQLFSWQGFAGPVTVMAAQTGGPVSGLLSFSPVSTIVNLVSGGMASFNFVTKSPLSMPGGRYEVTVTALSGLQSQSAKLTINIAAPPPPPPPPPPTSGLKTSFTFDPVTPKPYRDVCFLSDTTGGIPHYTYSWDFGDGNTATTASACHQYTNPATYLVTLTVTDSVGTTATAEQQVTVVPIPPPVIKDEFLTDTSGNQIFLPTIGSPYDVVVDVMNPDDISHDYNVTLNQIGALPIQSGPNIYPWMGYLGVPTSWDMNPQCFSKGTGFQATPCNYSIQKTVAGMATVRFVFPVSDRWDWIPPFVSCTAIHPSCVKYVIGALVFGLATGFLPNLPSSLNGFSLVLALQTDAFEFQLGLYLNHWDVLNETYTDTVTYNGVFRGDPCYQLPSQCRVSGPGELDGTSSPIVTVSPEKKASLLKSIGDSLYAGTTTIQGFRSLIRCALVPATCPFEGTKAVLLFMSEALLTAAEFYDYRSATDPSPDYATVVTPSPLTLVNGTGVLDLPAVALLTPDEKSLLEALAQATMFDNATTISTARYFGALQAGAMDDALIQRNALVTYSSERDQQMTICAGRFSALASQFPDLNSTDVQAAHDYLLQNGLPAVEQQIISGLGFGSDIPGITQNLVNLNSTILTRFSMADQLRLVQGIGMLETNLWSEQATPAGENLTLTKSFTDGSMNLLPVDSNGNPGVNVVLVNGRISSTNPGQVLDWTNATNTGTVPLQSLTMNVTMPLNWILSPAWFPAKGAIMVLYQYANGTKVEITNSKSTRVLGVNPATIDLSISSFNSTLVGRPMMPGDSVLLSVKLVYSGTTAPSSFRAYPVISSDYALVSGRSEAFYMGGLVSRAGSGSFVDSGKVAGDMNRDGKVDILDVAMMANAFGAKVGDAGYDPVLDINSDGVIDINDVAYVANYFGNHA